MTADVKGHLQNEEKPEKQAKTVGKPKETRFKQMVIV
jgi:hypothetical protein